MRKEIISQRSIFDYFPNTEIGDLERLHLCLCHMDSNILLDTLDAERGNGRNDFPNRTMWCCIISQFLFQRLQVAQMRRELAGNPTLRKLVGLNDIEAVLSRSKNSNILVPNDRVFSNFMNKLINHQDLLDCMFSNLRRKVFLTIPEYGVDLAGDGKYFDSYTPNVHKGEISDDRRAEHDAKYSKKAYSFYTDYGEKHTKIETHYGFRKHTILDVYTELPVGSILTTANEDEKKNMIIVMSSIPSYITQRTQHASFDRGYDSEDFIKFIRSLEITPIVDKRLMRKNDPLIPIKRFDDVFYTDKGAIFVYDPSINDTSINPDTGYEYNYVRAKYDGYDSQRDALVYYYNSRKIRIYIKDDPRTFNEVARDSDKFKREYNKRTSVERYHGRFDRDFGFENNTIRGLQKMRVLTTIGDIVMLSLALAHYDLGQSNYASIFDFGLW